MEHGNKRWIKRMKNELLKHGDHNVIIISWLSGSKPPYTQATANIRLVGVLVAHFLQFLQQSFKLNLYHVHLIGHSLGAHLAG